MNMISDYMNSDFQKSYIQSEIGIHVIGNRKLSLRLSLHRNRTIPDQRSHSAYCC